jgi:predicted Rossmann fold nucleotide-binding protein DprA/Smf involved in DNA uptake
MIFNENQIATYLFCAALPDSNTTPLTIIEWNLLVQSLSKASLEPKNLYTMTPSELNNILIDVKPNQKLNIMKKVESRKELSLALVEMERVVNQGINILFRKEMPNKLKKIKIKLLPPFFYSVGDLSIFNERTISVVGSRDATDKELEITKHIGIDAASKNIVIVSGGARGVDKEAVNACLDAGGRAIVFCSDGISKHIKNKRNRELIAQNRLVILSAQHIGAGFQPSYAMQRNKYIHASGDFVIVTSSQISNKKKSGTWEGVLENFEAGWSTIYACGESLGVMELLNRGIASKFVGLNSLKSHSIEMNSKVFNIEDLFINSVKRAQKNNMEKEEVINLFTKTVNDIYRVNEKEVEYEQLNLID